MILRQRLMEALPSIFIGLISGAVGVFAALYTTNTNYQIGTEKLDLDRFKEANRLIEVGTKDEELSNWANQIKGKYITSTSAQQVREVEALIVRKLGPDKQFYLVPKIEGYRVCYIRWLSEALSEINSQLGLPENATYGDLVNLSLRQKNLIERIKFKIESDTKSCEVIENLNQNANAG